MTALTQDNNPIVWQELRHQQRSSLRFVHFRWLGPLLLVLMVGAVAYSLNWADFETRELAIYMMWIVNVAVCIRALAAGANAISREHVGLTWDSLVLTGVSARRILFGKWQAALQRVTPWMVALVT